MGKFVFKIHWSFFLLGLFLIYFGKGLLFFCYLITVILHEMGHAFVGKQLGYKLNVISLLPYGASLSGNNAPFKPKDEIFIAIAGPIVNILLLVFTIALWWLFPDLYSFTTTFAIANLSTLLFNLLPVFPLDGGRVLLGILNSKYDRVKAFKTVQILGIIITFGCVALFIMSFFKGLNYTLGINSLFLLIGLFEDDKSIYYINTQNLKDNSEKLKKGIFLKTIVISENSTVYDAYKVLDKNHLNQLYVMDGQYKIKRILMENEVEKLVFNNPLDALLKTVI